MAKVKKQDKAPPKFVNFDEQEDSVSDLKPSEILPTYDVPIRLIEPNEFNPNEMDDDTFNRLVEEMENTGMISAIQVVPAEGGKFRIIGGEHRWFGAKTLGWETVPCNVLTDEKFLDDDLQKLLTVRLNVIQGKLNPEKFTKLYEGMVDRYGADQLKALFGFTSSDAWGKLTKGVQDAVEMSGVVDPAMVKELEKKTKRVKSVDGLSAILKTLFKKYGQDLQHSFMIFVHGGKRHLYVTMNEQVQKSVGLIVDHCRKYEKDINEVIGGAMLSVAENLTGDRDEEGSD